ncbi:histidine kinase [Paraflavitalea sp. CAU 1676]|uniref:tetratricopeptide repeat-containing sensor histidine kinase n=1 Tax=Paraflavitalea sp. CAU 1676 TaxID=3032598 RepID=UPI0023DA8D50|nr:histidine kinase [Paraflavitalea sp. CAU 1676]MDF2193583.1 tetratricopeptide repeat protein [Paraflavitalea sp. CAU 1676]
MGKQILLACICVLLGVGLQAQQTDSLQLLKLKASLPTTYGTDKADLLNRIAARYIWAGMIKSDSGIRYAQVAFDEAQKLKYQRGIYIAANHLGNVLLQQSKPDEGIRWFRLSTKVAAEQKNDTLVALGYRGTGQALWYRGDFEEAIHTIDLSIRYFKQLGLKREISDATMTISSIYGNQGNYEKAFEIAQHALALSLELRDRANIVLSLVEIGKSYRNIGDHASALEYYRKAAAWNPWKIQWAYRHLSQCLGDLYSDLGRYDSAWHYYQESYSGNAGSKSTKLRVADYYLQRGKKDSAEAIYTDLYHTLKAGGERHIYMYAMLGLGKIYLDRKDFTRAKQFAHEALNLAEEKNARLNIRHACELLTALYDTLKQPTQSYYYYRQYVQTKEAILSDQFKGKLYEFRRIADDEKNLTRIQLLEQEKLINEQKLRGNQLFRNILLGGLALVAFLSLMVLGNISLKRKNEKLKNEKIRREFEHRTTELEMQALRAQMNPHFLFNCLSSINRFILKNEAEKASDYLTRFSRLIRLVLINSQKPLIVLEDEIEMLRLYLEMEQLRFKNAFDYSIIYNNDIEPSNIMLPPLLLQPFCENAIWHGLMHKEGHGQLSVAFSMRNNVLNCVITDNGIGRAKAAEIKSKSGEKIRSMGIQLTADRLALFNEDRSVQHYYRIEDITDDQGNISGTEVNIGIRYKEQLHETA